MRKKILTIAAIFLITMMGALVRFWDIGHNPVSLNIDEVSFGYNAYSILKTGRDEYGTFLPLTFKSVGDYKNPVPFYLLVPIIALFGLNDVAVRLPAAFFSSLTVPLDYFLLREITGKKLTALLATALLAISPWHVYFSRYLYENIIALFLICLATFTFLKMQKGSFWWGIISALAFVLAMYTASSQRIFVPLFIAAMLILSFPKIRPSLRKIFIFLVILFLLISPLAISSIFGPDLSRGNMVFIAQDIDFTRYVILDHIKAGFNENLMLVFFWVKRYLNYFQPDFLFFSGLNMTLPNSLGLGVMYFFEIPTLLWGIWELVRAKLPFKTVIILWILLGIFPASLTNNEQSAGRALIIIPPLVLISALGAAGLWFWMRKLKRKFQVSLISLSSLVIIVTLIHAFLTFTVHFPMERGEAFMEGTKEAVLFALGSKDIYQEIVFDPKRGVEVGDVVSIPHMYLLFYSQYDPITYHQEVKKFTKSYAHFDKFTIRDINWRNEADRKRAGTLFIGSPWSLPEKDLKKEEILKKIYLTNGRLAFLIVTPKP